MTETSPLVEGLLGIHKIITRGLNTSIQKCDEYLGYQSITPNEADGFTMYVSTLKWVTHAHHLSEEDIAFPYFKDKIEAPYDRLEDDHHAMARILDKLGLCLLDTSPYGVSKLRGVLGEFETMWWPHIRTEEENFTSEKLLAVTEIKEQLNIAKKLADHSRKNGGPGPKTVPFMFYNLEGSDRATFMMSFPWVVKKVLVPVVWKGQWKAMEPFLI